MHALQARVLGWVESRVLERVNGTIESALGIPNWPGYEDTTSASPPVTNSLIRRRSSNAKIAKSPREPKSHGKHASTLYRFVDIWEVCPLNFGGVTIDSAGYVGRRYLKPCMPRVSAAQYFSSMMKRALDLSTTATVSGDEWYELLKVLEQAFKRCNPDCNPTLESQLFALVGGVDIFSLSQRLLCVSSSPVEIESGEKVFTCTVPLHQDNTSTASSSSSLQVQNSQSRTVKPMIADTFSVSLLNHLKINRLWKR
jgi:hypothetical protein